MKENMNEEQLLLDKFCQGIRHENRFFVDDEMLNLFNVIIDNFSIVLRKGARLYRGRVNPYWDTTPYTGKDIGKPDATKILKSGRLNPQGISYMYLANHIETVIAELKPNVESFISVAEFELVEDLKVVKFSNGYCCSSNMEGVPPNISLTSFMILLSSAFSRVIDYNKQDFEYAPTQYFAGFCKSKGIDGIMHLSSVMNNNNEGHYNFIFFEDTGLRYLKTKVYSVNEIKYDFSEYE